MNTSHALVAAAALGLALPGVAGAQESRAAAPAEPKVERLVHEDEGSRIEELRDDPRTLIFFESPHRLRACLADLLQGLGDRPASLSREITKKFEETRRGSLSALLAWVETSPPRGEFVLVVGGSVRERQEADEEDA